MTPEALMRQAIESARLGIGAGQSPFGCAIACDSQLVACCHNTVLSASDITAHAEVNALRAACLATNSILLTGAVVAATCEPCPMCTAALHWARVDTVYYGASIQDAREAGFNELELPARELLRLGGSPVRLVGDVLADECRDLFQQWLRHPGHVSY